MFISVFTISVFFFFQNSDFSLDNEDYHNFPGSVPGALHFSFNLDNNSEFYSGKERNKTEA